MRISFEWDPEKAAANLKKRHVSFDLAKLVFSDPFAVVQQDRIEGGERCWQTLGVVGGVLFLLVAHTVWEDDEGEQHIRIISARRAEPKERRRYEQQSR